MNEQMGVAAGLELRPIDLRCFIMNAQAFISLLWSDFHVLARMQGHDDASAIQAACEWTRQTLHDAMAPAPALQYLAWCNQQGQIEDYEIKDAAGANEPNHPTLAVETQKPC